MASVKLGPFDKILLLGGGQFTVEIASWAANQGTPVHVITAPRHAREMVAEGRTFEEALGKNGISYSVREKLDPSETVRLVGTDVRTFCLSLGAAWVFSRDLIVNVFKERLFNLHGTRLPQNRGGGGISWQILTGDRFGFCQLHFVDGGLDSGDIVASEEFLYPPSCRIPSDFIAHYEKQNKRFITEFFNSCRDSTVTCEIISQPEYLSTYWPRLHTPTQAWINWAWDAHQIERFICAFDEPYQGAKTTWNEQTVRVKSAFASFQDGAFHPFQSGLVYRNNSRWLCVAVASGSIIIEVLEDDSGNNVLQNVRVGDRLVTLSKNLEESTKRLIYSAGDKKK